MNDIIEAIAPNFNIGIDCEDVERWRKMLPKLEIGAHKKLFSEKEHLYCMSYQDPAPHYAVRWCAKEALVKAFSPFFKLDLRSVEISKARNGRPFFILNDDKAQSKNFEIQLSMSHSKNTAQAIVIVVREAPFMSNLTLPVIHNNI